MGEGKPNNQNHAIIFTRGEAVQAIDMNQDASLEDAIKIRQVNEQEDNECIVLRVFNKTLLCSIHALAWP